MKNGPFDRKQRKSITITQTLRFISCTSHVILNQSNHFWCVSGNFCFLLDGQMCFELNVFAIQTERFCISSKIIFVMIAVVVVAVDCIVFVVVVVRVVVVVFIECISQIRPICWYFHSFPGR